MINLQRFSRAVSWNWELKVDDQTIHPLEIAEFGEGEEGRIEVADGDRKYKIRDQIFNIDEIEVRILITKDRFEYDIMQHWCTSGETKNVYLIARDSAKETQMTFLLTNTDLAMGKHNAFNRKNKEEDTKRYFMIPEYVDEI
jgi:hypothetical protein